MTEAAFAAFPTLPVFIVNFIIFIILIILSRIPTRSNHISHFLIMADSENGTLSPLLRADTPTLSINAFSNFRRALSIVDQVSDVFNFPFNADISQLLSIIVQNRRFFREEWLHRKRKRWSWVGDHGTYLVEINREFKLMQTWWSCNICDAKNRPQLYRTASTNAVNNYLIDDHKLSSPGDEVD